jgi:GNAT superfamily N-acetyltransferase
MNIQIISLSPEWYTQTIQMIQRTIRISQKAIYPPKLTEKFCHKYDLEKFKLRAKEIEYFVALDSSTKKIVGIVGLKENELRTFFVDPAYQGKGVGRLLYNKLEQTARDRKIKKLVLYGSPLGEPAYIKFGFHKIRSEIKEFEGITFTDAYMEKELE